jgi:DNA-binding NarL/FixJ family response regulator
VDIVRSDQNSDTTSDASADDPLLRIFLIDDSSLVRAGLIQIFREHTGFDLVGSARDNSTALEACLDTSLDALVVNASCRSIDIPGLIQQAAHYSESGASKILLLANDVRDGACSDASNLGAGGVVLTWETPKVLVSALQIIARGYRVFAPNGAGNGRVPLPRKPAQRSALDSLTVREREVLELMARGLRNSEIARDLVISESTVKTHVQNLLIKLGLRNRASAVAAAYELGITRTAGGCQAPG